MPTDAPGPVLGRVRRVTLAKYDGEYEPGKEPVEVITIDFPGEEQEVSNGTDERLP